MSSPGMPPACRKALFMVRKRPSRSTKAKPMGSISSRIWTLVELARLGPSSASNIRTVAAVGPGPISNGTLTIRRRLASVPSASSLILPSELGSIRSARSGGCLVDAEPPSARSEKGALAATSRPSESTRTASTPAAASRSPVWPAMRLAVASSGSSGRSPTKLHSSRSPPIPIRRTSTRACPCRSCTESSVAEPSRTAPSRNPASSLADFLPFPTSIGLGAPPNRSL